MTNSQILWGLNTFLFIVCFFFVRVWINSLGKTIDNMEIKLNLKLDSITCKERNSDIKEYCNRMSKHKHAPVNDSTSGGGEVILP